MHIIIYARVSTDSQTHDAQLHEIRAYCARRGWSQVEEITDVASGAKSSRQGLDRLMALVRRGKVDTIVCFKLDRLGRSLGHLAQIIGELTTHPLLCLGTSVSNPPSDEFASDVKRQVVMNWSGK